MRTTIWAAAVAVGVLGLAGCGSDSEGSSGGSGSSPDSADVALSTADSPLGEIVVDADGRSVYVFDKDDAGSGKSACSGDCLDKWPPVTTDADAPEVNGVTGDVGTITRDDGSTQVTLEGMPLYLFAGDSQAGDVTGQAVGGVWWVVAPDGAKISAEASSSPAPVPGY